MDMKKKFIHSMLFTAALVSGGCSLFRADSSTVHTKIIPAQFGGIVDTPEFRANREMPRGHIIWGNDIQTGTKCMVVITNATQAKQVYRHEFIYNPTDPGGGYNYTDGLVVEPDITWNRLLGQYLIELIVNGRCINNAYFKIVP